MKIAADIHDRPAANCTPCGHNATLHNPISTDGTPELGRLYEVPARQGRAVRVAEGPDHRGDQHPRHAGVRLLGVQRAEPVRVHVVGARPRVPEQSDPAGRRRLATNRRRPILTLVEDTSPGIHDTLMAACDLFRYTNFGVKDYHDNCADNLRMAMMAIGVPVLEVPQPFNLWMNIPVAKDWSVQWLPPVSKAGDRVAMRAEMDCICAMSACPQDMIPINNMQPVGVEFRVPA